MSYEIIYAFFFEFSFSFVMSIPIMGPIAALVLKDCFSDQHTKARYNAIGAAYAEAIYACFGFILYFNFFQDPDLLSRIMPYLKVIASLVIMNVGKTFIYMDSSSFSSTQFIYKPSNAYEMLWEGFSISIFNISLVANHLMLLTYVGNSKYISYSYLNLPFWSLGAFCGMVSWYFIFILLLELFKHKVKLNSFVNFMNYLGFGILAIGAFTFLNSLWSLI